MPKDSFYSLYSATCEHLLEYKKNTHLSRREAENSLRLLEIVTKSRLKLSRDCHKKIYWEKEFYDKLNSCLQNIASFQRVPVEVLKKDIYEKAGVLPDKENIENHEAIRNSKKTNKIIIPIFILLGLLVAVFSSVLDMIDPLETEKNFVTNEILKDR